MTGTLVIPEIFYPRLKNSGTNLVLNHIRPRMLLSGIETFGDDSNGFSDDHKSVQKGDTDMYYVKRILIGLLLLTTLNFYIPDIAISEAIILSKRDNITTHLPESVGTPEKDISGETTTVTSEKGSKKWLWTVLGLAAIVGIAAGTGSGGGNGGGSNGGGTGSINVSW